jgi:DNA-binding XRE family transcriptional regulator
MPAIVEMIDEPLDASKATPRARGPAKARGSARPPAYRKQRCVDPDPDVAKIRFQLDLTQEELGRALGYSTRSIAGWESGRHAVSASARLKLIETARLARALAGLMPKGSVGPWLRTTNGAFGGQMPLHLIELGQSDRLWQMIHQVDANVAN